MRTKLNPKRLGPGVFVIIAVVIQAGLNFILHTYSSRVLGPESYAQLGTLLNITLFLAVPLGAVQLATSTATGRAESSLKANQRPANALLVKRQAILWASVAGLLVLLATPLIAKTLNLSLTGPVWLLGPYIALSTLGAAWRGVALGRSRFGTVGVTIALSAFVRLTIGIAFTHVWGIWAGMIATLLAESVSTFGLLPVLKNVNKNPVVRVSVASAVGSCVAFAGLWLYTSVDTLLALTLLPGSQAGQYTASVVLARAVLMVPVTIAAVSVAKFAAVGKANETGAAAALKQGIVVTLALLLIIIPVTFFTGPITELLFGTDYVGGSQITSILLIGAIFYGVVTLNVYYLQARGQKLVNIIWVGASLETLVVILFAHSATSLAAISTGFAVAGAVVLTGVSWWTRTHEIETQPVSTGGTLLTQDADLITDPLWRGEQECDVSIVVPFYDPNPKEAVETLESLYTHLKETNDTFEIIAVNDGSTNDSGEQVKKLAETLNTPTGAFEVLTHAQNQGKGAALTTGFIQSKGKWIGFVDADGDISPGQVITYLSLAKEHDADMVAGSKLHPESSIARTGGRNFISKMLQQFNKRILKLEILDTQVGIKVINRQMLADVLPKMYESNFAFDLEMFVIAKERGHTTIIEAPVHITTGSSTLTKKHFKNTMWSILNIWHRKTLGEYHPEIATLTGPVSEKETTGKVKNGK